jgi:hypothetical protein
VFAAIIDQPPLGVANPPRLLDPGLALWTAKPLRMKIVRDPAVALALVQQLDNGKYHVGRLAYAQLSDMSHQNITSI